MRMIREVVILSFLAIVSLCVLNIATASSSSASQSQMRSDSPIHITITDCPKQVSVGQNFDICGVVTNGNTGFGNVEINHIELIHSSAAELWTVTTDANGSFVDTFHFNDQGTHVIWYTYTNDGQTAILSDWQYINAIPR